MMAQIVKYEQVKDKIIVLRGKQVILDSDVAQLYGVETKRINEAVKNNPDKFPEGYLIKLDDEDYADLKSKVLMSSAQLSENEQKTDLRSKISTSSWGGRRTVPTQA